MMRVGERKGRRTERSQIRGCCYVADRRAFVFGAMHIIALSPASSSELLIGVPSAFDTNIYTTHTHRGRSGNTPTPSKRPPPPSVCVREKVPERSVRHGRHKDVIKWGEEGWGGGGERRGGEGREEGAGEAASSVSSEIGVAGSPEPFPSPRLRAKEAAETEKKKKKPSMTKKNEMRLTCLRHAIRERKQIKMRSSANSRGSTCGRTQSTNLLVKSPARMQFSKTEFIQISAV